jgi:tetratricopeptide (TPR) repeat protein
MSSPKTAAQWLDEGLKALELSHSADTTSELRGDRETAVAAFTQALVLEPGLFPALIHRAFTLADLEEHETALDAFVAALEVAPSNVALRFGAVESMVALKKYAPALEACEVVVKLQPDHRTAPFLRAKLLCLLERDVEAVAAWDVLLPTLKDEGPGSPAVARMMRACSLARLGRADARAAFREVFDDGVDRFSVGFRGNPVAEALRQFAPAREAFQAFVSENRATRLAMAADAWLAADRPVEALETARLLVEANPSDSRIWFHLAEVHAAAGRVAEALAAYDQSLAREPGFLGAQARRKVVAEGGR